MIDPSRSGQGGCCLLHLVDLIQDGVEGDRAFDDVLPPESLSFAGQAAISRCLACQSNPEPVAGPMSLSGTAGPVACGETGMAGSLSGCHSVGANRPDRARKVQRNPIQNGGCNEGNGSAMECLSYLYQ